MKKNSAILAALVIVLALVVFLVVDLQSRSERDIVALFQNQQYWVAQQIVKELHDYLEDRRRELTELAGDAVLQESDTAKVGRRLTNHLKQSKYIGDVSLCDAAGRITASTSASLLGQDVRDADSLQWARQAERRDEVLLVTLRGQGTARQQVPEVRFVLVKPLYTDSGTALTGLLNCSIDLNAMVLEQPILSGTRGVRLWIMDAAGKLLVHSEHPEMLLRSVDQAGGKCMECHTSLDYARTVLRDRQGTIDYTIRGFPKKLAAFAPLRFGDLQWKVVVTSPYDEVTALAKKTAAETILLLTVTTFAFIGGAVLFFRNHNLKLKAEEEARVLRERSALEDKIQLLAARLLTVQEDETRRLSRELHDDINQRLAMLAMDLELLEMKSPASQEGIKGELSSLRERVSDLSDCVHDLAYKLHPAILDDLGLVVALKSYIDDYAAREGIEVAFDARNLPEMLEQDIATCLYRVVQEGLRNVAKHAEAKTVRIALECSGPKIILEIQDSGVGFVPESQVRGSGLGLVSMSERVRLVRGEFLVASKPGQGTQISVRIPLKEASADCSTTDRSAPAGALSRHVDS
jgi:signal transduction histidine kinase